MEQTTPVEDTAKAPSEQDGFEELLFVPDDKNPALIDAQKTFAITLVGGIIFMGAVAFLIL